MMLANPGPQWRLHQEDLDGVRTVLVIRYTPRLRKFCITTQ